MALGDGTHLWAGWVTLVANKVHDIINEERRRRRMGHVLWSREMAGFAQSQANYCARVGRLVHSHRYAFQGGENLAEGGPHFTPRQIVDCWLHSKAGHREYLLSPRVKKAGVGIARRNNKTFVAWAFSDAPPAYPDCPHFKGHVSLYNHKQDQRGTSFVRRVRSLVRIVGRKIRGLTWRLRSVQRRYAGRFSLLLAIVILALVWGGVEPVASLWRSCVTFAMDVHSSSVTAVREAESARQREVESDILKYTNAAREGFGLSPLVRSDHLDGLASAHCQFMMASGCLSHDGFERRASSAQ
ncbi:MAG: hypothetical protein JXA58_06800, partial [Dehalococcoidia bacterium]|nr:hypothetical protein [Dehalococcoidia bacterium]